MRYTVLLAATLVGVTLPALAQDRTPPAGSLRALEAPVDWSFTQGYGPRATQRPVFEGRSVSQSGTVTGGSFDGR